MPRTYMYCVGSSLQTVPGRHRFVVTRINFVVKFNCASPSLEQSKPSRSAVGLLVYIRLNMYVRVHNICVCRFIDCIISVYISKVK